MNQFQARGEWSPRDAILHINALEMLAVRNSPTAFLTQLAGLTIQLMSDNATVVSHLSKEGGTVSVSLYRQAREVLLIARELRRFALRFFHSHSGATGVFCLICRTVYFRCAANLIVPSSKIGVFWLKVRDLLIKICVHCALLCLAFLVLGRS